MVEVLFLLLYILYSKISVKKKQSPYLTILTLVVVLQLFFIYTNAILFLYISLGIAIPCLFSHYVSIKIDFLWLNLADLLSKVMPTILLVLLFYLFLFPLSLFAKLFSKEQPLSLKNNRDSTFTDLSEEFNLNFFKKLW